jgi:hypothetical protein
MVSPVAADQRGENAHRRRDGRYEIRNAGPRQPKIVRIVHDRVEAAEALANAVVGRPIDQRSAAAEPRHGRVHDIRIDALAYVDAETKGGSLAGPHVLHDHVESRQ